MGETTEVSIAIGAIFTGLGVLVIACAKAYAIIAPLVRKKTPEDAGPPSSGAYTVMGDMDVGQIKGQLQRIESGNRELLRAAGRERAEGSIHAETAETIAAVYEGHERWQREVRRALKDLPRQTATELEPQITAIVDRAVVEALARTDKGDPS